MARVVTLALPRHLVTPRFSPADGLSATGQLFEGAMAVGLLRDFLFGLADDERDAAGRCNPLLDAAGALVGLCLAERPTPPVALSALATARAEEILRYLDRNFANAQLTPASMADDLGISVRYAHKLLEQTGRSFRRELISLRLNAARRAFAGGRGPRQTIADIAISVGFNDLSQFNRHFRAAFGMTPRAARRQDETVGGGSERPNIGSTRA
jgi:AraC-like DNA-binding protein